MQTERKSAKQRVRLPRHTEIPHLSYWLWHFSLLLFLTSFTSLLVWLCGGGSMWWGQKPLWMRLCQGSHQLHLLHAKVLDPARRLWPVRATRKSRPGLKCPAEQTPVARLLHAAFSLTPAAFSPAPHKSSCTDACDWTRNAMRWSWYHWAGQENIL